MPTYLPIISLDPIFLSDDFDMTCAEYTAFVNSRVNETDIVAENRGTHVNLHLLPY